MKLFHTLFLIIIFGSGLLSQTYTVSSVINGTNEVPSNMSMGTGTLVGSYDSTTNMITINATYANLTGTLSASHLHKAPSGTNGGVIVNLAPTTGSNSGSIAGSFSIADGDEAELIAGNVYINLHSSSFGGGELRGQLALSSTVVDSELDVESGDLTIASSSHGIILKSSSGLCFRIQIGDDGKLINTAVSCQ